MLSLGHCKRHTHLSFYCVQFTSPMTELSLPFRNSGIQVGVQLSPTPTPTPLLQPEFYLHRALPRSSPTVPGPLLKGESLSNPAVTCWRLQGTFPRRQEFRVLGSRPEWKAGKGECGPIPWQVDGKSGSRGGWGFKSEMGCEAREQEEEAASCQAAGEEAPGLRPGPR